jgi:hypothetical protein
MSERSISTLFPLLPSRSRQAAVHEVKTLPLPVRRWDPEAFARDQIRGLVQRVFFSKAEPRVRQIMFSAMDPETDIRFIGRAVAEELARENAGSVAVVGRDAQDFLKQQPDRAEDVDGSHPTTHSLHAAARQLGSNLWSVPDLQQESESSAATLHSRLLDVRREFDYSVIAGPPAGGSQFAATIAQLADGIVLVLSARYTRRAGARKIKQAFQAAQVRVLGTVLIDRDFPIPETMYRRL